MDNGHNSLGIGQPGLDAGVPSPRGGSGRGNSSGIGLTGLDSGVLLPRRSGRKNSSGIGLTGLDAGVPARAPRGRRLPRVDLFGLDVEYPQSDSDYRADEAVEPARSSKPPSKRKKAENKGESTKEMEQRLKGNRQHPLPSEEDAQWCRSQQDESFVRWRNAMCHAKLNSR